MKRIPLFTLLLLASILFAGKPEQLSIGGLSLSPSSAAREGTVDASWYVVNEGPMVEVRTFLELSPVSHFVTDDGEVFPCSAKDGSTAMCAVIPRVTSAGEYLLERGEKLNLRGTWEIAELAHQNGDPLPGFQPMPGVYEIRAFAWAFNRNGRLIANVSTPKIAFEVK